MLRADHHDPRYIDICLILERYQFGSGVYMVVMKALSKSKAVTFCSDVGGMDLVNLETKDELDYVASFLGTGKYCTS